MRGIDSFQDVIRRSQDRLTEKNKGNIHLEVSINKYQNEARTTNNSLLRNNKHFNSAEVIHPFNNKFIRNSQSKATQQGL